MKVLKESADAAARRVGHSASGRGGRGKTESSSAVARPRSVTLLPLTCRFALAGIRRDVFLCRLLCECVLTLCAVRYGVRESSLFGAQKVLRENVYYMIF